jgi:hypothetical protein
MTDEKLQPAMPEVGDFFASSGGYDQTNVHFYRVTKVTAKSVWLQPWSQVCLAGSGSPQELVTPGPGPVMIADPTDPLYQSFDYWDRQRCRRIESPSSMHRFDPVKGYARMSSYEWAHPVAADVVMYQTGMGWGH